MDINSYYYLGMHNSDEGITYGMTPEEKERYLRDKYTKLYSNYVAGLAAQTGRYRAEPNCVFGYSVKIEDLEECIIDMSKIKYGNKVKTLIDNRDYTSSDGSFCCAESIVSRRKLVNKEICKYHKLQKQQNKLIKKVVRMWAENHAIDEQLTAQLTIIRNI